jgi:hypothetical protein
LGSIADRDDEGSAAQRWAALQQTGLPNARSSLQTWMSAHSPVIVAVFSVTIAIRAHHLVLPATDPERRDGRHGRWPRRQEEEPRPKQFVQDPC